MWRRPCGPMSGRAGHVGDPAVHQRAHRALVDPPAPGAEEQRRPRRRRRRSAGRPCGQPAVERAGGRVAEGHDALLAALAEHAHHVAVAVHVVDVEAGQLADPDAGGVEQLEHRHVAQPDRAAVVGQLGRGRGSGRPPRRRAAPGAAVRCALGEPSVAPGVRRRRPVRCSHAVNTRAAVARRAIVVREQPQGLLLGQPAAQRAQVELVDARLRRAGSRARAARRRRRCRPAPCAAVRSRSTARWRS